MRAVTTATAATVLGIERRSLDNLLLQLGPLALPPGRQGLERRIPVSLAFPSVSVSYAVIAVLGYLLWSEPMGWPQVIGIALICSGVVLLYQVA